MKHSFITLLYKGSYIHICYNPETKREEIKCNGIEYKSLHSAKIMITKSFNNN